VEESAAEGMTAKGHFEAFVAAVVNARLRLFPRNSDPLASDRDDRLTEFNLAVSHKNLSHRLDSALSWNIRKANNAGVNSATNKDQSCEIRVNCDEDSLFFCRQPQ
jgi:hypothetical protein